MSKIQEVLNNIVNYIQITTQSFIDEFKKAEKKEKAIEEKMKDLKVFTSDEEIELCNKKIILPCQKEDLSKEDRDEELQKIYQTKISILSSKRDKLHQELCEEKKLAQELQEKTSEDLHKNYKNIKNYIAEKYISQVIEAIEIAKREGEDPNPVYQGEGEFKGDAISHFVADGLFKEDGIKILSCLNSENIKRMSGFESVEFEVESDKESELMKAIKNQDPVIINWFLDNDKEVNQQKASGSTPLHMSALVKDYETTKSLLEKGVNPNVINKYGCTPLLDLLIDYRDIDLNEKLMLSFLKLFKTHGADFNLKNQSDLTIFEQYICSDILPIIIGIRGVKLNNVKAILEILILDEKVKINLDNKYVNKFFTNIDNLNRLISQNIDDEIKVTILCKLQKALLRFEVQKNYTEEKVLEYFEEIKVEENGAVYKRETNEDYKIMTTAQLQEIIVKKVIDEAQILYDRIQDVKDSIGDASSVNTIDLFGNCIKIKVTPYCK